MAQPHVLIFQQPWWLDAVCKDWGVLWIGVEGLSDAYSLPIYYFSRYGLRFIEMPLLTPYWLPASAEKQLPKALKNLSGYAQLQLNTAPGVAPIAHLGKHWRVQEQCTYLLSLQGRDADAIFQDFHPKLRNMMRRAQRVLEVVAEPLQTSRFISWSRDSYRRFPYSDAFLRKIWTAASDHKASLSLVAKNQSGEPVAMLWAVYDHHTMYLLQTAYNREARQPGAVGLLIYHAMQSAIALGLHTFDFEGSSIPSIANFFERFGGEKTAYYSYWHTPSLLWRLKQRIFS